MVGQRFSHYRVLEKIGSGGMGEVYLAQDEKLQRHVALKLLPDSMKEEPRSRERLEREARAAASLDHPFICKTYDILEEKGKTFIVMEYVVGKTLQRMLAEGPFDFNDAIGMALEIAEALQEAHSRKLIHRDLKPSNVMLTEQGHVKVMDFGLAKPMAEPASADSEESTRVGKLTEPGARVGTPAYMSPEQITGGQVDSRTDIFSFGVLLCEMLTGTHPFQKENSFQTMAAILYEPPSAPDLRVMPRTVRTVLDRLLEKEPANRYQTFDNVRVALQQLRNGQAVDAPPFLPQRVTSRRSIRTAAGGMFKTRSTTYRTLVYVLPMVLLLSAGLIIYRSLSESEIGSVAVLRFENAGGHPEQQELADGLAEGLIHDLSGLNNLTVISRASSFRLSTTELALDEIGRALRVDALIAGQLRLSEELATVSIELIDAADASLIWGEQFSESSPGILQLRNRMSTAVIGRLRPELPEERALGQTKFSEAYWEYLKGRKAWSERSKPDLERALLHFTRAVSLDPEYALAYSGLADTYVLLGSIQLDAISRHEAMESARIAVSRALEIDDSLAEAHASLAFIRFWHDWDFAGSETLFHRAIALNPNYATAHKWYADLLAVLGRQQAALREARIAERLDPFSPSTNLTVAMHLYYAREYEASRRKLVQLLEDSPDFVQAHLTLGTVHLQQGDYQAALETLERARALRDGQPSAELGYGYAMAGWKQEAIGILHELTKLHTEGRISPLYLAVLNVGLGDYDQALTWLERAYEEREQMLDWLVVDPLLDPIRADERYLRLLRAIGLR